MRILEKSSREDAVTLRAIAGEIGIAAPSIYAHFSDREEIIAAVIGAAFDDLLAALTTRAIEAEADPVERLRAGCAAYLRFAHERPQRYRILFQNRRPPELEAGVAAEQMLGYRAFSVLVGRIEACVAARRSRSDDPFADATALWVALHGYATLRTAIPNFPWPAGEQLSDRLVLELAKVD